ncbi:MAG: NYN domain-containing protein [Nitrospirota bacterium]|nr:NYN domain-containing protein [Nitrospirota bacterium]
MKRSIIFWDFSNFQITLSRLLNRPFAEIASSFDYAAFARAIQSEHDLIKIYFACSHGYNENELAAFYRSMDYHPFFYVRIFDRPMNKTIEKQVDVYLATQMVALAYENVYDIAFLVSGDEDFVPAIEVVHQKGKIVVAVAAETAMSRLLKRRADRFILIDDPKTYLHKPYYYENFLKS